MCQENDQADVGSMFSCNEYVQVGVGILFRLVSGVCSVWCWRIVPVGIGSMFKLVLEDILCRLVLVYVQVGASSMVRFVSGVCSG